MKRIYVAGPYSANNVLDLLKNIGRGEKMCSFLFEKGFAPFCPWHDKSYVMDNTEGNFTVQQFYDYSMAWLEVSDAVLLIDGWEESKGTLVEIERASELDIPVFGSELDLFEWDKDK
jgi:nucleoside 2-deoxyribosyltransferase